MISGATLTETQTLVTQTLVLEKPEECNLSPRILELRKKIHSEEYLDNAIQRIAQVISKKLMENSDELKMRDI